MIIARRESSLPPSLTNESDLFFKVFKVIQRKRAYSQLGQPRQYQSQFPQVLATEHTSLVPKALWVVRSVYLGTAEYEGLSRSFEDVYSVLLAL